MFLSFPLVMVVGSFERGKEPQVVPTKIINDEQARDFGIILNENGLWSAPSLCVPQTPIGHGWKLPHHCKSIGIYLAKEAEDVVRLMKAAIGAV